MQPITTGDLTLDQTQQILENFSEPMLNDPNVDERLQHMGFDGIEDVFDFYRGAVPGEVMSEIVSGVHESYLEGHYNEAMADSVIDMLAWDYDQQISYDYLDAWLDMGDYDTWFDDLFSGHWEYI